MRYKTMTNSEKALQMHETWNGKIETTAKSHVNSREDLAIAYTPGVAEPCKVIAKNPDAAYKYTIKANTIAVVSDGSAVLGLGNIGESSSFQRIRRRQCGSDLLRYSGYRRDHPDSRQHCPCIRRDQSGGHLRSALF